MFKKIHSNIDPNARLGSELRKEFSNYFNAAETRSVSFLTTYPREVFFVMVVMLALSAIVCFVVYNPSVRAKEKMHHPVTTASQVSASAIAQTAQLVHSGQALARMYQLRTQIKTILAKPKMNHADSALLLGDIAEIENAAHLSKPTP